MLLIFCGIDGCGKNENYKIKFAANIAGDSREVSVAEFRLFIEETGYKTTADSFGWSGYFDTTKGAWGIARGANWRRIDGVNMNPQNWPVTQVSYYDACAYCAWKNGRLPTASEWDAMASKLKGTGNIWQGTFPIKNKEVDGYSALAPVGSFLSNKEGFYDLAGNVWEWTSSIAPQPQIKLEEVDGAHRIIKGGSYLCIENGCEGYKPEAFQHTAANSGTNHLGFRCVYDL
ncbi:SUMF1/EgtB/PvdO family nonheme iron enzyme [Luteibaculum oceani]|nr:SUMF1/EgtB/PvdO family nonheme iron enzyme [Luteibaculum oceani]